MTTTKSATEEITTHVTKTLREEMAEGFEILSEHKIKKIDFDFYMVIGNTGGYSTYILGTTSQEVLKHHFQSKQVAGEDITIPYFHCKANGAYVRTEVTMGVSVPEGLDIHV